MSKLMKKGHLGAITVDGPKGPRHSVKPGVIFVAKQSKTPIVPIFMTCKHAKVFNSWDKYILPAPFSKVQIFVTEPVVLDDDTSAEAMERDRAALEMIMQERTREYTPDYI
jgi:lysophospholipid acyltransferase (LPLAT)-like uncharacterized protein